MAKKKNKGQAPMAHITGLWWNKSKTGNEYMAGYMGNSRILIFEGSGSGENSPDMNLYVVPKEDDDGEDSKGRKKGRGRKGRRSYNDEDGDYD